MKNYNGWKNYETWHINLMLRNSQQTESPWLSEAADVWAKAKPTDVWDRSESARFSLADTLKDFFGQGIEMAAEAIHRGHKADDDYCAACDGLMRAGFEEIEWDEIAAHLLEGQDGFKMPSFPWQKGE